MAFNFLGENFLAQLSHVLAGALAVAYLWVFLPGSWLPYLLLAVELGVLGKEALVDPRIEHDPPQPFFWSGAEDWAFWQPGIGLTLLLLFVAHKPL